MFTFDRLPVRVVLALLVSLVWIAGGTSLFAPAMVFPTRQWQQSSPRSQSVDETELAAAVDYLHAIAANDFGCG